MDVDPQVSCGAFIKRYPDNSESLRVEVKENGEVWISQYGKQGEAIIINGVNVHDVFWLSKALRAAGELSKKCPLS